jgi:DNA-binding Lrp family transcriptional regulator
MLVLIRLYPKSGLAELWNAIELEKRRLYWKDVNPLYAIQQERKRYLSIILDVRNLESLKRDFLDNILRITAIKKVKIIPIMSPLYFPLPERRPEDFNRYQIFLKGTPEKLKDIYPSIITLDYPAGIFVTYLSYSFGDDDIIMSLLAKDRETVHDFVESEFSKDDGVLAYEISRVMRSEYLLPPEGSKAHRMRFQHSKPAGKKGRLVNPDANEKYMKERAPMTIVVRLFAKKSLAKLWEDIEESIPKFESKNLVPLYASQQEAQDFISVIFEATNFEVLKDVLTENLPTLVDARKTRTVPLLEPTYFLLPKDHPKDLKRYLITLQVEPSMLSEIRGNIVGYDYPDNVYLSYLAYLLGEDDIMLSILSEDGESARKFAKDAFDKMEGVRSYDISDQLKTKRLTSKQMWKRHQGRFLSSYDKQHRKEYDARFDWTDDDSYEYAAMTGAFPPDMEH